MIRSIRIEMQPSVWAVCPPSRQVSDVAKVWELSIAVERQGMEKVQIRELFNENDLESRFDFMMKRATEILKRNLST